MYPLNAFLAKIGDIPYSDDPQTLQSKSPDWSTVSPILRKLLRGKSADIVVSPRTKAEVIKVVSAAATLRIPVTPRGGGTANYGQSVPMHGGILLDMAQFAGVVWTRPGAVRALAGTNIHALDEITRRDGWELRMHPSSKKNATIGGFISGGSGGIGGAAWGGLRDRGNILALEVISMEETPRVRELRGREIGLVQHAFGTNCIITEVEMPLAPAWPWIEAIVTFPAYMDAVRFGAHLCGQDGIIKKLISVQEWPTPYLMAAVRPLVPEGHSTVACLIAAQHRIDFEELVADAGGTVVSACAEGEGSYGAPLYEFAFGHALLQIRKTEPARAAVQGGFRGPNFLELVERVHRRLNGAGPLRMEITLQNGQISGGGGVFAPYTDDAQLAALSRLFVEEGVMVNDVHSISVQRHRGDRQDRDAAALKKDMDPYNLLNPGKWEVGEDGVAAVPLAAAPAPEPAI